MNKIALYSILILFTSNIIAQVIPLQNKGHVKLIADLKFSDDEKKFVTAGTDNLVKIWDFRTLKEIKTFEGHNYAVNALDIYENNNKQYIISGSIAEIIIWDLESGKVIKNIYSKDKIVAIDYNKQKNIIYYATQKEVFELDPYYLVPKRIVTLTNDIVDFKTNKAGTSLLVCSKTAVFIYDMQKKLTHKLELKKYDSLHKLSSNTEGNKIIASGQNYVHSWHIKDTNSIDYWAISDANASAFITFDGSKIYARKYQESIVYIYDYENKKLIDSLEIPNKMITLFGIVQSKKGNFVGGYGYNQIMFWDIASGKKIHDFNKLPNTINTVVAHQNLLGISIAGNGKTALFDWEKCIFNEIENTQTDRINFLYFDTLKQLISHAQNGSISIQNTDNHKTLYTKRYFEAEKKDLQNTSATQLFLNAFTKNVMYEVAFSSKNNVFALTGDHNLYLYDFQNNIFTDTLKGHKDLIKSIRFNSSQDKIITASLDKTAIIWDLKNPGNNLQLPQNTERLFSATFSQDENYVYTGDANGTVNVYDVNKGTLIANIGHFKSPLKDFTINNFTNELIITTENSIYIQNTQKSELLYKSSTAIEKTLALNSHLYAIHLKNATLLFVHKSKGLIGTLLLNIDDKLGFVFYTPDGYYMGDKQSVKDNIHFIYNNNVFLFEQFDLFYNRPDIIIERLGCTDLPYINSLKNAFEKRIEKLGYNATLFDAKPNLNVPQLKLVEVPFYHTTKNKIISFEIEAYDAMASICKLQINTNGVPLYLDGGKTISHTQSIKQKISFELANGKNIIELFVTNQNGINSLKERFIVNYIPEKFGNPNLYIVTIGASEYQNESMNLKYASKDGDDIVTLFKNNNKTYEKIHTLQLKNKNVTLKSLKTIEQFVNKARIDDVVLFFISGHGVFDAQYNYYIATYDMDFFNPKQKGIPYAQLESILGTSKSRNKVLFLDACHSGEIDKDEVENTTTIVIDDGEITFRNFGANTIQSKSNMGYQNSFELQKQLFTDLRNNNGTNVVSASGGTELAMEGKDWQNGVFSYSLLSGIIKKEADLNNDGIVMISELQEYLSQNVLNLTNGKQKPTTRVKNLSHDIIIWSY